MTITEYPWEFENDEGDYPIDIEIDADIADTELLRLVPSPAILPDYHGERDAYITFKSYYDEWYESHGLPAFLCELSGTDSEGRQRTYRSIGVTELDPSGWRGIEGDATIRYMLPGTYTLFVRDAVRHDTSMPYTLSSVRGSVEENGTVTFNDYRLSPEPSAKVTVRKTTQEGGSDTATAVIEFRMA